MGKLRASLFHPLPSHLENAGCTRGGSNSPGEKAILLWAWVDPVSDPPRPQGLKSQDGGVARRLATRPFFMGVERGRRRFLLSPGIPRRRVLIRSLAQQRAARGAPLDALPLAPRGRRDAPQCVRAPRRARRNPRSRRPQGSTGAPPGLKNLTGAEAQLDLCIAQPLPSNLSSP